MKRWLAPMLAGAVLTPVAGLVGFIVACLTIVLEPGGPDGLRYLLNPGVVVFGILYGALLAFPVTVILLPVLYWRGGSRRGYLGAGGLGGAIWGVASCLIYPGAELAALAVFGLCGGVAGFVVGGLYGHWAVRRRARLGAT